MLTVNHCFCRRARRPVASGLLFCTALVALALPIRAHAQLTGKASATGQFESNSNVFDLESGVTQPGSNGFRRSDTYYAYGAEFDGNYLLGRQQIYATASTTEYDYQHFTELHHTDYKLDAGLNWIFGELLDGKLDVARTRTMVPFVNLSGSVLALTIATEQRETVQVGFMLSPDWKVEGLAFTSTTDEPIPEAPNLQLTQTSGTTSIKYLGFGRFTSGLTAGYLSGDYSGSNGTLSSNGPLNPSYSQETVGFLADEKLNRTTLEAQVGYTRRVSSTGIDNTSGLTGLLEFKEQVTPKTSFTVKIDRTINSYLPILGSEIDSEAGVGVNWQATYKLAVSLDYTFTYRDYPRQSGDPVGSNRVDYQQNAILGIDYHPQRWLLIRPYANVLTRDSNVIGADFNSTIFGVSVTATTPDRRR
jgi:hypothetical protein